MSFVRWRRKKTFDFNERDQLIITNYEGRTTGEPALRSTESNDFPRLICAQALSLSKMFRLFETLKRKVLNDFKDEIKLYTLYIQLCASGLSACIWTLRFGSLSDGGYREGRHVTIAERLLAEGACENLTHKQRAAESLVSNN